MRTAEGQAVASHEQHLHRLYEVHAVRALRFAYLLTGSQDLAEDLMQEAFIRAFDRLGTLREETAFPGYLRATILNLARAHFRRKRIEMLATRRHAVLAAEGPTQLPDVGERERVWEALQKLPFRQRAALVLRYYQDLSEKDSARALGTSVSALKALVSRGAKALRIELKNREDRR